MTNPEKKIYLVPPVQAGAGDFDVLIVGGGVIGLSTAYHLAKGGKAVAVFDRSEAGTEASSRNGGGVRQQNRNPAELPLAMASVDFWTELAKITDFEYVKKGNLRLALEESDLEFMDKQDKWQHELGLETIRLNQDQVLELCPWLNADLIVGGSFCPSDGHANPILAARAMRRLALEQGVALFENTMAEQIIPRRDGSVLIKTANGDYRAGQAVLAAGGWTSGMLEPLGLSLPLRVEASCVAVTERVAPMYSQFIYREQFGYTRQAACGNIHLGAHVFEATDVHRREVPLQAFRQFIRLGKLIPALKNLRIIRTWSGFTTWTPDKTPVLDFSPLHPNLFVAAGMSGHGFCLAPGVGRLVSELLMNHKPSFDPTRFRWDRFTS